jgi:AAA15 family ATPase/GTPase
MLIEFTITNYRSIQAEQTLSLLASAQTDKLDENAFLAPDGKTRLLHSAVIYGANASGKSNLLEALNSMRQIVLNSHKATADGDSLPISPYFFDPESQIAPTSYSVAFFVGGVRYEYGFVATSKQILEEWLFAYATQRPQKWFERVWHAQQKTYNWSFSQHLKGAKQVWQAATRPNVLFLSQAVNLNSEQLQPIFDWFGQLQILNNDFPVYASAELSQNPKKKQAILQFLQNADFAIQDFEAKLEDLYLYEMAEALPRKLREAFHSAKPADSETRLKRYEIKTQHLGKDGQSFLLDFDLESKGTQKFFALAGPWLEMLAKGNVVFFDELNSHLHPDLVGYLVKQFHTHNPHHAQLVLTTHDTTLLSRDIFRRDQVWFVEKDAHNASTLFSLVEFGESKEANIEKRYLQGRYGAVPILAEAEV